MISTIVTRNSLKTRITLSALAIFLAGLWSLAFYVSQILRKDMERLLGEQQFLNVSMLAAQVNSELDNRLKALEKVAAISTQAMMDGPAAMEALIERQPVLQSLFNGGITVFSQNGTAIVDYPLSAGRRGVNFMDVDVVAAALKEGKSTIGQPALGKSLKSPVFGMAVPVRDTQGNVIGALGGPTDLGMPNFLDRITENRYGKTGGYLLIAPQYRLIVSATDKRRSMEVLPGLGINPSMDHFIQGYEGSDIFVNPHGMEVLASAKSVPVAGWYVASMLPTAEAFAPIRNLQQRMLLAALLLTLLAGGLTWGMLRRQLSPMLAAAKLLAVVSDTNQPLQPLPNTSQDEIGQLIGGFNRLLETLGQRETDLKQEQLFSKSILDSLPGIFYLYTYPEIQLVLWNKQHETLLGYTPDEMKGRLATAWFAPELNDAIVSAIELIMVKGQNSIEAPILAKDGHQIPLLLTGVKFESRGHTYFMGTGTDITERKNAEEEINSLAFYDPLTRLPNRRLLIDRLKQAMASSTRNKTYGALLFIDLDNFKTLNDTRGHDIGDLLLQQVGQLLTASVSEGDTVARFGGDEFVVMLEDLRGSAQEVATQTESVGNNILAALSAKYQLGDTEFRCTASIGATLFRGYQTSIENLLKQADLAMYQSKETGRNALLFFDPAMQTAIVKRAALESGLRKAIEGNQLLLHYQAQVVGGGRVTGAEALVRWQHPQRGMVFPDEFIPLAEETGLILPLGDWVLETACTRLALWATQPEMADLTLAVNVSAKQFREVNFVDKVLAIISRTGANPNRLKLELTESLLVNNVQDIIEKMFALKARGIGFSLDDFGTGYSSLSYLKRLPLDQLKIDRSFVRDILVDPNDAAIAKMVVALAESLGLAVIAEGVETEAQMDFLARHGCHAYQGYLFSRPLPLEGFDAFVKRG